MRITAVNAKMMNALNFLKNNVISLVTKLKIWKSKEDKNGNIEKTSGQTKNRNRKEKITENRNSDIQKPTGKNYGK